MKICVDGSMGDEVGITGLVREYKRIHPDEIVRIFNPQRPQIWQNNYNLGWGVVDDSRKVLCYSYNPKHDGPRTEHYCNLAGLKREDILDDLPELYFSQEELDWRPEGLELGPDCVAIDPGAGWFTRMWPEEKFHFLSAALRDQGYRVFQVGARGQRNLEGAVDLVGRFDIRKAALFLAQCGLYVGNDSGLFHLAAAVGAPHVVVYGVSRRACGPYSTTIPVYPGSECDVKCYMRCVRKGPVFPPNNFCMSEITVDQVLEACHRALRERRGAGRLRAAASVLPKDASLERALGRLGSNAPASRRMVELALERKAEVLVEAGASDGGTVLMARLAADLGGKAYSVDRERLAIYRTSTALGPAWSPHVSFAVGEFQQVHRQLAGGGRRFDLLSLDRGDQVRDLEAAYLRLSSKAIVAVNSAPAEAWLQSRGWRCEARSVQSVWVRN